MNDRIEDMYRVRRSCLAVGTGTNHGERKNIKVQEQNKRPGKIIEERRFAIRALCHGP